MRLVIQRVSHAKCEVEGQITGEINQGLCVFIGVSDTDTTEIADKMLQKVLGLRIFRDENDKSNLSLRDVNGSLLMISQFTLYADCRKGNRPSFTNAGKPELANELYEYMISEAKKEIPIVQSGIFAADMNISLCNQGPFTIVMDSDEIIKTTH